MRYPLQDLVSNSFHSKQKLLPPVPGSVGQILHQLTVALLVGVPVVNHALKNRGNGIPLLRRNEQGQGPCRLEIRKTQLAWASNSDWQSESSWWSKLLAWQARLCFECRGTCGEDVVTSF